jgi:hypothetical protein
MQQQRNPLHQVQAAASGSQQAKAKALVRGPQFAKEGFAVSGCPIASLNTQFTQRGEFKGFPLYREAEGGPGGLWYANDRGLWYFLRHFTETDALVVARSLERLPACSIAARAVDGGVPLGQQTWRCYVKDQWQDCAMKVVPRNVGGGGAVNLRPDGVGSTAAEG